MTSILFFFIRKSTPLTLPSMPCCLKFIIAGRSSFGAETLTPILAKECVASSNISEACSSAFDGMQPTLRQVPPSGGVLSTTATFMPSSPRALNADLRRAHRADITAGSGTDNDEIVVGHDVIL